MNIKKTIAKILGISLIVSTIATSALAVNAITETDNITKTYTYTGTYSKLYAYQYNTGIVNSSNYPDYASSYKKLTFTDYTFDGVNYNQRYKKSKTGTNRSMVTEPANSSSAIAKRYHSTAIYYTSQSSSGIRESHTYTLYKH